MQTQTLFPGADFRVGFSLFHDGVGQRIRLPFRRSIPAILIIAAAAIVMTIPAISTFTDAAQEWGKLESLFELTSALFLTGWLLGWSMGLLIIYALLAVLLWGGETLLLRPGTVEIRLGLPVLFVKIELDPGAISKLQHKIPQPKSGTSWRGPHLSFLYNGTPLEVGSAVTQSHADELARSIRAVAPRLEGERNVQPARLLQPTEQAHPVPATAGTGTPGSRAESGFWSLPVLALLGANLVPVAGVLLYGWDLGTLMVLFWAESGIIGIYNLCKMAVVQGWAVLFTGPIFIGHFGAFMAIHFLFVFDLFVKQAHGVSSSLADVAGFLFPLWPALLAMLLSHGLSFVLNFLGRREYRNKSAREQMQEPYRRVVIMHLTVIFGGGLALALGSPLPALLLLLLLKTVTDIRAHHRQRQA